MIAIKYSSPGGGMNAAILQTLQSIKDIIDRRRQVEYLAPFDYVEVLEALSVCYAKTSRRRLKRLALSIAQKLNNYLANQQDWHRRALKLVSRYVRKCFFKPKAVTGIRSRRVGGSSFFISRLNLRNAP